MSGRRAWAANRRLPTVGQACYNSSIGYDPLPEIFRFVPKALRDPGTLWIFSKFSSVACPPRGDIGVTRNRWHLSRFLFGLGLFVSSGLSPGIIRLSADEGTAADAKPRQAVNEPGAPASRTVEGDQAERRWPLIFSEDFQNGAERWQPVDPEGWRVEEEPDGNRYYHQFRKDSSYQPEHRSPLHQSYVRDLNVGSFELLARVRSTHADYGHRDACLFFGRLGPSRLYYVHLGKVTDDHANQIFIVREQPRTKISTETTPGTPWDDEWHRVQIVRDVEAGTIVVYFDDLKRPAMQARDTTFAAGSLGVGSFDDTSAWDDIRVYGERIAEE
jgi:hypothetical protein